jgi:hypothetical protein
LHLTLDPQFWNETFQGRSAQALKARLGKGIGTCLYDQSRRRASSQHLRGKFNSKELLANPDRNAEISDQCLVYGALPGTHDGRLSILLPAVQYASMSNF